MKPAKLSPDNFTPATRTPWGGTQISARYKAGLDLAWEGGRVGESWEISVEPSFPSRLVDTREPLADVIGRDPVGWLGESVAARFGGQTPLLVKLLDSADNLSVQVHPQDGDPALAKDESGKPESWVILGAQEGAGIYLGFKDGVDRATVQRCLQTRGRLDELLNFVPVSPGDTFAIGAGSPHAIGAGVTLVEPQFVRPGRRGVTYRFWDWNRLYDAQGQRSRQGQPRALHVERSLAVTAWDAPRADAYVAQCRQQPRLLAQRGAARRELLLDWPWFTVERWSGEGVIEVRGGDMWAVVCVAGEAELLTGTSGSAGPTGLGTKKTALRMGESAVIPAGVDVTSVAMKKATLIATRASGNSY